MNKDLEHLRLLSIFHYVVGGMIGLAACIPIVHLTMGIMFLTGAFPQPPTAPGQSEFPIQLFGLMFTIIPLVFIILGWTLAICTIVAGRKLAKHQGYTFCLVIAGLVCLIMPFGTILGVFTFIVLFRDSVKNIFNGEAVPPSGNPSQPNWQ